MADLRALETPLPQSQPPPREEHRDRVPGWLARRMPSSDKLSPINQRRAGELQGQPARLLEPAHLPHAVRRDAVRRVPRQRSPAADELQGRDPVARPHRLSGIEVRRLPRRHRLQGSGDPRRDQGERLGHLAADPLLVRHHQQGLPGAQRRRQHLPRLSGAAAVGLERAAVRSAARSARALQGVRQHQLARARQSGARRRRPRHLRLPHLGAVRAAARHVLGRRRRHGRRRCRATSAAAPISSSSASSRCGPRYRRCSC